jgi:DNA helicase HerA-like ATPase
MSEPIELFPPDQIIGIFRGFTEGGLEFHADLVLPYRTDFHNIPMHGQFLLVRLESEDEAVLGRITSLSSEGRLTGSSGEDFTIRAIRERRPVSEQLREDYLKYHVNIRVLGVLRRGAAGELTFVASHRRLPHVGSPVAFLCEPLLREVAGHNVEGVPIGYLAMGEYIYADGEASLKAESWMQIKRPSVVVKFAVDSLISRRTFVFARAGFGKSNLNKLLFSNLYRETPTVEKRAGRRVPVGTVIFDPDGEYFWPDDKGRPGLCDVPELQDKIVVFTSRQAPSPFYGSFIAGGIKLDIRRFRPADIIALTLTAERQDQQNVAKIKGLDPGRWGELVDLIDDERNGADIDRIGELLRLDDRQDYEALAARSNMTRIVEMIHDRTSQLMDQLLDALSAGKLCIVDVSQLRGGPALSLSGIILRRIFDHNQEEFTKARPRTIPTIAVVEEAQAVLNERAPAARSYIEWVKEGRKYDLGAVLITQQPGAIPTEILSQGDNWFIFHLLSSADLRNVQTANSHFSGDLLSSLLNEPIIGQGVLWSSVKGTPYPIPVRVFSFEHMYQRQDQDYTRAAVETYATGLKQKYAAQLTEPEAAASVVAQRVVGELLPVSARISGGDGNDAVEAERPVDVLRLAQQRAIEGLDKKRPFRDKLASGGIKWGYVAKLLEEELPERMSDRDQVAYGLVKQALITLIGPENEKWRTEKRNGSTFIVRA